MGRDVPGIPDAHLMQPGAKMAETVPATGAAGGNQQLDTPDFLWELSRGTRPKGGFVVLNKEPAGTRALDLPVTTRMSLYFLGIVSF